MFHGTHYVPAEAAKSIKNAVIQNMISVLYKKERNKLTTLVTTGKDIEIKGFIYAKFPL